MKEALSFLRSSFHVLPATPSFISPPSSEPRPSIRITSELEIRVCTSKTCRRQGSMDALQTLAAIAPPAVTIKSCGCLGRCGAGPNLVALPSAVMVGHCGTTARAAAVLMELCGASDGDAFSTSLAALALRKRGESESQSGNFSEAERLLTQAIDLKPYGGIHLLYKERSGTRVVLGNYSEALEDAKEVLAVAPEYPEGYICQGDALLAMNQLDAAEKSYLLALQLDPLLRRSKSFKAKISKLHERLATASV